MWHGAVEYNTWRKILLSKKLVADLLQSIDARGIADPSLRQTVEVLLNVIEELNLKVKSLESENQKLRDENNRLKGRRTILYVRININKLIRLSN